MARTTGSDGTKTRAAIQVAAAALIARHGYEAMSMRQLAAEVGVQAAALYRYFPTKQDLLFTLMKLHMDALLKSSADSQPATKAVADRLSAFVHNHIHFHVERRHSTHVSNMELRSLTHENLTEILRLRTRYEKQLRQILREGDEQGAFHVEDARITAMAIIQMITGVIVWFRPEDRLSVEEVARTYHTMTMRLVGAGEFQEDAHVHPVHEFRL